MKKITTRIFTLILAVLLWAMFIPAAFAVGSAPAAETSEIADGTVGVTIPVTKKLSGTLPPKAEEFVFIMAAQEPTSPMPEGTNDAGECSITIKGAGTESFPAITFDKVGVYNYAIYEKAGSDKLCTYDKTVYYMVVTVANNADYTGLEASVALHINSLRSEEKTDKVVFLNNYKYKHETPTTGDNSKLGLYIALCGASAIAMGTVLVLKKYN